MPIRKVSQSRSMQVQDGGTRPVRGPATWRKSLPGCGPARSAAPQLPLTCGIAEIVDCACCSAALGVAVPVIAAWIAVQIAWETFG
jgi:hypothetical protein